jgi:serine/threonine protein kinase/tetratricopeptide (TPR) repeat protein
VEAYLAQHPDLQADDELLLELIYHEMVLREERLDPPRLKEYVGRFPRLAGELEIQFEVHEAICSGQLSRITLKRKPAGTAAPAADSVGSSQDTGFGYPAPRPPLVPGYEILGELGRGGMGVVYRARQASLNRTVALKMILAGPHAGSDELARFRTEAAAVAQLQHPHIVQIHEVGEHDGRPYLALEFVGGGSLARALAGNPQPADQAARLVETLARAMHFAHQHGIVHRDLKPANILLAADARRETQIGREEGAAPSSSICVDLRPSASKITDFGLAKRLDEEGPTQTGAILGTPSYMAPEQAEGGSRAIGPAVDVYALGAILYELLTGRPPFRGTSRLDTLDQVRKCEPVPPSRLQPGVPRDAQTICLKCLQKEPARRYATAEALADDLARCLAGKPIQARPVAAWERGVKWARRQPALAGLLAVSGLAALGLALGIALHNAQLQAALKTVQTREQEARQAREREQANYLKARNAVDEMLTQVGEEGLANVPQMEPVRRALLEKALTYYQGFLQENSTDAAVRRETGRAHGRLGEIYFLLGRHAESERAYRQAIALHEELAAEFAAVPDCRQAEAKYRQALATVLRFAGRLAEAEQAGREALALLEKLAADFPDAAELRYDLAKHNDYLGTTLREAGKVHEAEQAHRRALALWEDLPADFQGRPECQARRAGNQHYLAMALVTLNQHAQAEQAYRRAIAWHQKAVAGAPAVATYRVMLCESVNNLGVLQFTDGRSTEAEQTYRQVLAAQEKLVVDFPHLPEYRAVLARLYANLSLLLIRSGRAGEGEQMYRDAVRLYQKLVADFPNAHDYPLQLARCLYGSVPRRVQTGQLKEAEQTCQQIATLLEGKVDAPDAKPDYRAILAGSQYYLSCALRLSQRLPEAEKILQAVVIHFEKLVASRPTDRHHRQLLGRSHRELGILFGRGRPKEAEAAYRRARDVLDSLAADYPDQPEYRNELALSCCNLGMLIQAAHPKEAEEAYRRALALQKTLAADYPENAEYRSNVGATLNNLAGMLVVRQDLAESRRLLEEAVGHQLAAWKHNPKHATYRSFLRNHYVGLAAVLVRLGEHTEAARTSAEAPKLFPDGWQEYRQAAAILCQCSGLAEKDAALPEGQRQAVARGYADQAVGLLRQAVTRGYKDRDDLQKDPVLSPLRSRADFQKLLAELEAGAKPGTP